MNGRVLSMGLITGAQVSTYFSPDDDTQNVFLQFIHGTKHHLRIAIYSLHLPPLINDFISLHQSGIDLALVCDHSQALGKYEQPEIAQLKAAGVPLVVGTSQKHKIMHHKFAVQDQSIVEAGSWNYSLSASAESNFFDIVVSTD